VHYIAKTQFYTERQTKLQRYDKYSNMQVQYGACPEYSNKIAF